MITTLFAGLALTASLVMLFRHPPRLFPIIAVVASSIELLSTLGVLHLRLGGISLGLVCGIALVIAGVAVHIASSAKMVVTAATAVALVGALQILSALHLR
jgi:hypothetical protein